MTYVDGFVAAVPTKNKEIYITHAKIAANVFKEYGALEIMECWGDDIPDGKVTSFPMAVKQEEDETVIFSWIVWPSKEVRDASHPKGDRSGSRDRVAVIRLPHINGGSCYVQMVPLDAKPSQSEKARQIADNIEQYSCL